MATPRARTSGTRKAAPKAAPPATVDEFVASAVSSGAFRVVPAHDPTNQIPFEVPLSSGDVVSFSVPKLQFFPKEKQKAFDDWLAETNDDGVRIPRSNTEVVLFLLEMFVEPAKFEPLSHLSIGELVQIDNHWLETSNMSLPESSASVAS